MSQLIADLGGCLGLYIGVSVISLMEFSEHFMRCLGFGCKRVVIPFAKKHHKAIIPRALRKRTTRPIVLPVAVPALPTGELPLLPPLTDLVTTDGMFSGMSRRRPVFFSRDQANPTASRVPSLTDLTIGTQRAVNTTQAGRVNDNNDVDDDENNNNRNKPARGETSAARQVGPLHLNPREWITRRDRSLREIQQTRQRLQELSRPGGREPLSTTAFNRTSTPPPESKR